MKKQTNNMLSLMLDPRFQSKTLIPITIWKYLKWLPIVVNQQENLWIRSCYFLGVIIWILKRLNVLISSGNNMNDYLLLMGSLVNRCQAFQDHKKNMSAFFHWSKFLQILGDVVYNLIILNFWSL
jgi:hypothetical protein